MPTVLNHNLLLNQTRPITRLYISFNAVRFMDKENGIFNLTLQALQYQIDTLLDNCGGKKAAALLDALSKCSPAAQEKLINCFLKVLNSSSELEHNPSSDSFEETLFQDICQELEGGSIGTNFEVFDGGALNKSAGNIIDFQSAFNKQR